MTNTEQFYICLRPDSSLRSVFQAIEGTQHFLIMLLLPVVSQTLSLDG